jgi:hypothetical protein
VGGPRSALPEVGQEIYIPTSIYLSHGVDDFRGGLCRIMAIHELLGRAFVEVEEDPGTYHSWPYLVERQEEWRARYGAERGRRDPDLRPEFNEQWTGEPPP